MVQCDICFRTGGHKLPFLCPTDARNTLYDLRIQNARVLLEKEAGEQEANVYLSPKPKTETQNGVPGSSITRQDVVDIISERDQAVDRTEQIIAHADELRVKVDQAREDIAKRKATISRRKSEMASASNGLEARRAKQIAEVEKSIGMTKFQWNKIQASHVGSRTYLCGEAAKLYGLRKVKKKDGLQEYTIGGVGVVDLRALNTATPAQISTSLSHVVHLLMLSMHYLSIRLPAEITLPHRDYPLPTIFPLVSSHIHKDVPFPGSTPGHSLNTSPTTSRHAEEPKNLPRPRPLFIKQPLPLLAKEDPSAYALFLEAVTLIAYNIAWVSRSQGIPVGEENSFDDICNIGRNLYNLLIGERSRPGQPSRNTSAQSTPTKGGTRETDTEERTGNTDPLMGKYSHGTAHSFLGSAEGTEFIRSWKLPSPIKLADKLKAKLMNEVAAAEWELLNENSWAVDDENEIGGDGVVVGARKDPKERERERNLGMQSFMSMRTVVEAVEMLGGGNMERKPGTSGWTKVKGRT